MLQKKIPKDCSIRKKCFTSVVVFGKGYIFNMTKFYNFVYSYNKDVFKESSHRVNSLLVGTTFKMGLKLNRSEKKSFVLPSTSTLKR